MDLWKGLHYAVAVVYILEFSLLYLNAWHTISKIASLGTDGGHVGKGEQLSHERQSLATLRSSGSLDRDARDHRFPPEQKEAGGPLFFFFLSINMAHDVSSPSFSSGNQRRIGCLGIRGS